MRALTAWAAAQLRQHNISTRGVVLFHLSTPSGLRVFCRTRPEDGMIATSGHIYFADGTWRADGSHLAGADSEALLDISATVLDGGGFSTGNSLGRSALEAVRERVAPLHTLILSNEPDARGEPRFEQIAAGEPVVGGRLDIRLAFPGGGTDDVITLQSFMVERVAIRGAQAVLTSQGVGPGGFIKAGLSRSFLVPRASRYASPENPADALPLPYGDLTVPARTDKGVYRCPKINTTGAGTYCVGGWALHSAASLFDDDGLIDPGDYTLKLANDYEGAGEIATAVFSVAPNGSVTAVCKGKKDSSGALIECPFRIVEDFFLNVWGYAEQDLARLPLERAAAASAGFGYAAAGVVADDHTPVSVLTDILAGFFGRHEIDEYGRLAVGLAGEEAGGVQVSDILPTEAAQAPEIQASGQSIVNLCPVLFARDLAAGGYIEHDDGTATQDAASIALYGTKTPPGGRLEMPWVRSLAVALMIQARVVERSAAPARIVTQKFNNVRPLPLQEGDYAAFTSARHRTKDGVPLINQIGEVFYVDINLREQTMEVRLRDTGYFLTTAHLADGSAVANGSRLAGGERDTAAYA